MRCRDYLGNTGDCRFDTTECEHHVTIPDAPPKCPIVGEPVKPIEPLSLLAGTGIVEVIRKMNEIIERLNAKGGTG
jgi:hypothetical protein